MSLTTDSLQDWHSHIGMGGTVNFIFTTRGHLLAIWTEPHVAVRRSSVSRTVFPYYEHFGRIVTSYSLSENRAP